MILAGDIGGTKTVLALFDASFAIVREAIYHCADYPSLEAILDQFLQPIGGAGDLPRGIDRRSRIAGGGDPDGSAGGAGGLPRGIDRSALTAACFGVAGPVVSGTAKITNLPWTIDAAALAARLGAPVALLNDLQATALGILVLPAIAFAVLQPAAAPAPGGTIAVIAPGTGLGEALLVSDATCDRALPSHGTGYCALPSEGGHADFAPGTDDEIELLRYLRGVHGPHVSYERVLSGAGIGDLYSFVRKTTGTPEPAWLTAEIAAGDRNAVISQAALDRRDPACIRALDMFVEILGAEAGNLALRGLAAGGVVIGGGIPPKILPALQHPRLLDRFNAKGRFAAWTRSLGVRVTLEPRAALFGAAHHAATYQDARS